MTTQLEFSTETAPLTQCERILDRLARARGEWVEMPALVECSGSYNIHSRISDLRKRGYAIEWSGGERVEGKIHSSYRLV